MAIPNPAEAAHYLSHVSFHRLRGYWESFEEQFGSVEGSRFQEGTTFTDVIARYNFDLQLRVLLLESFNHIEVSLRTQWAYSLAYVNGGGRFAQLDAALFSQEHNSILQKLRQDYEDYAGERYPYSFDDCPIWAIVEIMSLGQLSRWYKASRHPIRQSVAQHYGIDEKILRSFLRHLVTVRNICAHHEQLWDTEFRTKFIVPNRLGNSRGTRRFFNRSDNGKIYNTLVMTGYMMERISSATAGWKGRLLALLSQYDRIPRATMGFPPDWQGLEIWQPAR